jgi:hypothetical protein
MSQHDYVLANASGATVRADLNSVLQAILSGNSGTSAPTTTVAGMWWLDTTGGAPYTLKMRDAGNNHWLTVASVTDPGSDGDMELVAPLVTKGGTGQTSWTQGDILYASGSNALSKLGAGSSGQVLKTQGAGANPVWGSAPQGWTLLATATADDSGTDLDIGSSSLFSTTYSQYRITMTDLMCAGSDRELRLRTELGGTWKTTQYDFLSHYETSSSGSGTVYSADAGYVRITGNPVYKHTGNTHSGLFGEIQIQIPAKSSIHFIQGYCAYHNNNDYTETTYFAGGNARHESGTNAPGAMTKIRLYWDGGNFYRGQMRLYGITNS